MAACRKPEQRMHAVKQGKWMVTPQLQFYIILFHVCVELIHINLYDRFKMPMVETSEEGKKNNKYNL